MCRNGLGSWVNAAVTLPAGLSQLNARVGEGEVGQTIRIMRRRARGPRKATRTIDANAQATGFAIEAIEIAERLGAAR